MSLKSIEPLSALSTYQHPAHGPGWEITTESYQSNFPLPCLAPRGSAGLKKSFTNTEMTEWHAAMANSSGYSDGNDLIKSQSTSCFWQ